MKLDLYQGKLCCSHCHHLVSTDEDPQEFCPYCKKKLTREEIEHWEKEGLARELRKKKFDSEMYGDPLEHPVFPRMPESWTVDVSGNGWWKASQDNLKQMDPLSKEGLQRMYDKIKDWYYPKEEEDA